MIDAAAAHSFATLKAKQRRLRDGFGQELSLRVHRAVSWLQAAERAAAADDADTAFVCHWIAFNAAYAQGPELHKRFVEHEFLAWYFETIISLDADGAVYSAIWERFSGVIRNCVANMARKGSRIGRGGSSGIAGPSTPPLDGRTRRGCSRRCSSVFTCCATS